jgi:small-conductance mechanosensitive channel
MWKYSYYRIVRFMSRQVNQDDPVDTACFFWAMLWLCSFVTLLAILSLTWVRPLDRVFQASDPVFILAFIAITFAMAHFAGRRWGGQSEAVKYCSALDDRRGKLLNAVFVAHLWLLPILLMVLAILGYRDLHRT